MHIPDLAPYGRDEPKSLAVGWLAAGVPFPTAVPSKLLTAALNVALKTPVRLTRGFHVCPFCKNDCGSAEISVPGENGVSYEAPTLIAHYVEAHFYAPPSEFVIALLKPMTIAKRLAAIAELDQPEKRTRETLD